MNIENIINDLKFNENILTYLNDIDTPTICVGSGGSKVVASFAANILESKNKVLTKVLDVRDLFYTNLDIFENIFISSFSGSNFGVKASFIKSKKVYLLSKRKTKIKDEILLNYDIPAINSFISLEATIIPMTIMLKYYLGNKFEKVFKNIIGSIDKNLNLDSDQGFINIFSGVDSTSTEVFLESTFTESGMFVPLVHKRYDYCHGRSTINKEHKYSTIYLSYSDTDLDKTLVDVLKNTMSDIIILEKRFKDPIINDYYMCLQSMYLLINMACSKKIDLRKIKYDHDAVKNLYYFKGSM